MSTFLTLKTDVNQIADRTVADSAYRALTSELNSRLRLTIMESFSVITTVDDTESYALPTDFLEGRNIYINATPRTPVALTTQFSQYSSHNESGRPTEASVIDAALLLNPIPDAAYSVVLRYIAKIDALSGDADTNDILDCHYNVYLYGALKHHTALTRDIEMTAHWGGMFEQAIAQAQKSDARRLYGAESLAMTPEAIAR